MNTINSTTEIKENKMTDAFSRMVTALIANEVKLSPKVSGVGQTKKVSNEQRS